MGQVTEPRRFSIARLSRTPFTGLYRPKFEQSLILQTGVRCSRHSRGRSRLPYALELIGPIARSDLDLIRFIRNNFAHSRRPLNFHVPEVGDVCAALQYPDFPNARAPAGPTDSTLENLVENEKASKSPEFRKKPRNRYTMACHTLSYRMLGVVQLPATATAKLFGDPALP